MNTNRIFNWESSYIDREPAQQPKKKKGWLKTIKDAFTPSYPPFPNMRDGLTKIFREQKGYSTDERTTLGYETAAIVTEKDTGINDIDIYNLALAIAQGASSGKTVVGTAIAGPIGLSIPGFTNEPVLDRIHIEDTPARFTVAANTVLLMDGSGDKNLHSAFPKAASVFINEVASYKDDRERASAAKKIGEIINTPGISDGDRRSISRDSIRILKGNVSPVWVLNKSEEYASKGTDSALKFSGYLNSNLSNIMEPINNSLEKASSGKTGSNKVRAVLSEGRAIRKNMDPEIGILAGIASLKKLKSQPDPVSSNAGKILDLIAKTNNKNIVSVYANMALDLKSSDLSLTFKDLVTTGKSISEIKSIGSSAAVGEWFDSYMEILESTAEDPGEKKVIQSTKNILSKIDSGAKHKLANAFFNVLTGEKIPVGLALIAKLGSDTIKNMPEHYSSDHQNKIKSAKVFIDELSTQGGEMGKLMTHVSVLLDEVKDTVGSKIAKASLLKASESITSAADVFADVGYNAIKHMSEKYSDDRERKIKQERPILKKALELTSDNDTKRFIQGAITSLDGVTSCGGSKNGQVALELLASDKPVDPVVDLAKVFFGTISPMSEQYSSDRSKKTDSIVAMMEILRDTATDPGMKKRIERALDVTATIEEKVRNSNNEPVSMSGCQGLMIGMDVMKSISEGKTEDTGMEIGRIGNNLTKKMSTKYPSDRQKQSLMCGRFYLMIEKHAEKPEQKEAAKSFRELLEDLGDPASPHVGVYGLQLIGEGREFNLSELASSSLKMFNGMSEQYSSDREKKTHSAEAILKHLSKNVENDSDKKALSAGIKIMKDMKSTTYEFRVVKPLLSLLEKKPECSLATSFSDMGLEFINNNFDGSTTSGQNAKTTAAGSFLLQIVHLSENPAQRAIAQVVSMYCHKSDQKKGYIAARGAFKIISELEGKSGESIDMQSLISKIEENCPGEAGKQLSEFLEKSTASIYMMKEGVEKAGEAGKEIKQEEEYVVIGGVKLKKSRS